MFVAEYHYREQKNNISLQLKRVLFILVKILTNVVSLYIGSYIVRLISPSTFVFPFVPVTPEK